jgi:hypothetical protein
MHDEHEDREESRYGKDKTTSIDHTYIESGEYRRKYDNISGNKELNRNLYQAAKKILLHRSGTDFEDMYWFNADTGKEFTSITDMMIPSIVKYAPNFMDKYKNIKSKVTIHNHPRSMPPSIGDYESAYRNGYSEGIIACHDGMVYKYSCIGIPDAELYKAQITDYRDLGFSEFTSEIMTLQEMDKRGLLCFMEVSFNEQL